MVDHNQLIADVAGRLTDRGLTLVTAESCTGGMIAAELTAVPGSSSWFEGAFVTYRISAKTRMIGVRPGTLGTHGAVSEPVAREMAEGALAASDAGISVSVTGVAGPAGGDLLAPLGTVWFAWALADARPQCRHTARHRFSGSRAEIRHQAVGIALEGLRAVLERGG